MLLYIVSVRRAYPLVGEVKTCVAKLRMIANAIKHASPNSMQELADAFPELFWPGDRNRSLGSLNLQQIY